MVIVRGFGWAYVAISAIAVVQGLSAGEVEPALITGSIAAALGYWLYRSADRNKAAKADAEAAQLQLARDRAFMISRPITPVTPLKALLKRGEVAYAVASAGLSEVLTVGYEAGSAGASVRVAKGLTIRTGGTKGQAVKNAVIVADGEIVLTDSRIIFAGDRKSFAISREDLISTTNYADGFSFSDSKKTYTVQTGSENERIRFAHVLETMLRG